MRGPECPADFLRIVWIECTGVPGALGVTAKMGAKRGGWRVLPEVAMVGDGERRRSREGGSGGGGGGTGTEAGIAMGGVRVVVEYQSIDIIDQRRPAARAS